MRTRQLAAAATLVLFGNAAQAQAQAQEPGPSAPPDTSPPAPSAGPAHRFYAGMSVGRTDFTLNPGTDDEQETDDYGGSYRFGYRFHPRVAVEGFFAGFASATSLFSGVFDSGRDVYPAYHTGVALLGEVPLAGKLSAFGRVGIGSTRLKTNAEPDLDRSVTDPSAGVGLVLGPLWRFAFRLEAVRYTRSDVTTRQVAAEVRW
jgi:opacity protein-like surface antigen